MKKGMSTPTPVFLPGESRERRSLPGCSPWGCREPDATEKLTLAHGIIYVFWTVLGLCCCMGSLCLQRAGPPPWLRGAGFSAHWLFSLRSMGSRHAGSVAAAPGPKSAGSEAVALGVSGSTAWGLNPGLLAVAGGFFTPEPPGKPLT